MKKDKYLINDLINKGHLEKYKNGYVWTKESIEKIIKEMRHSIRYIRNPLYRFFVDFYRSIKNLFSF